ncbi:MAG: chitobiase/beta-hexosaminidase C-terminal domain-containing protein [Fibrobacteria bacterium]|nr:chitobiase/beta-hexosaminidase C-terminal domain-containing protein [Fibrobacteria bacterium]
MAPNLNYLKIRVAFTLFFVFMPVAYGLAPVQVPHFYEDTVRIGVIWNEKAIGGSYCPTNTTPVGAQTRDFVLEAIGYNSAVGGVNPGNVRVWSVEDVTWNNVVNGWGGAMPHVLIHIQAGWRSKSGPLEDGRYRIENILDSAANRYIGVVSVGDDAAAFAENIFGLTNVNNVPSPMGDARWLNAPGDSLWIDLDREKDTLDAPGIVRRAVDSVLDGGQRIYFKPYGADGRCQADADDYDLLPDFPTEFYGYQNGWDASSGSTVQSAGNPLAIIAVFQDHQRRGVALSFQPQYLAHQAAAEQIVYDGIVYGSFAHLVYERVETPVVITTPADQKNFDAYLRLSLECGTANSTMHYTTDGSAPNDNSPVYDGSPIIITRDFHLRVFAKALGYLDSDELDTVFTRNSTPSLVTMLSAEGDVLDNDILTTDQTGYTIRLSTNYYESTVLQVSLQVKATGDEEIVNLSPDDITASAGGYARIYQKSGNSFNVHSATIDNNILETAAFDTITITWVNPLDPADITEKIIYVEPADGEVSVHFSTSSSLNDTVIQFSGQDEVYVIVRDQTPNPSLSYYVILQGGLDSEWVALEIQGDLLVGHLSADYNVVVRADGALQPKLAGDNISATYTDPLYGDQSQKSVSYLAKTILAPTANIPDGAWFADDTTITLSSSGGFVKYRFGTGAPLDHPDSGLVYSASLAIAATTTVRAIAYYQNSQNNFIVSNEFMATFNRRSQVAPPVIAPDSVYFTNSITVSLTPAKTGDSIYFRTGEGSYQLYSAALTISATTTFDFYAVNAPGLPSAVVSRTYTRRDTLGAPIATPGDMVFADSISVMLSPVVNSIIRYTLDGALPTEASPQYSGPFMFTSPVVLKARSFPITEAFLASTDVMSHTYTPILAVSFDPESGEAFSSSLIVNISANTTGTSIYYTVNGSEPATFTGGSTYLYTVPLELVNSTTIKALAVKTGWQNSETKTASYTRTSTSSRLVILDANGDSIPNGVLTGSPTNYTVRISTNYAGSNTLNPTALSVSLGDSENLNLTTNLGAGTGYVRVFEQQFPMAISPGASSNGTLEVKQYDTLIVTWINPFDETDSVGDTIIFQPENYSASVHFAASVGGTEVNAFSYTDGVVYMVIRDQQVNPNQAYDALVTTESLDSQRVLLSILDDSTLIGSVPANYAAISSGDGALQINLQGEQINVLFYDSLYGEQATNYAEFGEDLVVTPVYTSDNGTSFADTTRVVLSTVTPGALIRFYGASEVDSIPTHLNGVLFNSGDTLVITSTLILRAVAYKENHPLENYIESDILVVSFTKNGDVAIPTATPPGGYFTDSVRVYLTTLTDNTLLWYTVDGSSPTSSGTRSLYDNTAGIFISSVTTELKFYGEKVAHTATPVITETYIRRDTLNAPTANPGTTTFLDSIIVSLVAPVSSGSVIRYTLNGDTPTLSSARYQSPLTLKEPTIIRARAFPDPLDGPYVASTDVMTHTYTPILVVSATPGDGARFTSQQNITLHANVSEADIFYTTDGSEPHSSETGTTLKYEKSFIIKDTTTIKAVALKNLWQNSDTLSAKYYRDHTQSQAVITDTNGSLFIGNILKNDAGRFSIELSTNYGGSDTLLVEVYTSGDSERVALKTIVDSDSSFARIYRNSRGYPFSVSSQIRGNGNIEVNTFDTLVIKWTNPLDPTDITRDTVYIEPVDQAAVVYFTETLDGSATNSIAEGAGVNIVVEDQNPHPDSNYTAQLVTNTGDTQIVALSLSGNRLIAGLPANYNTIVAGDGTLQINLGGEQIQVFYTDPHFPGDNTSAVAAYAAKTVNPPVVIPLNGTWFINDTAISLTADTGGAYIRWTMDGSQPGHDVGVVSRDSMPLITATGVLKAVAYLKHDDGNYVVSSVMSAQYNRRDTTVYPVALQHSMHYTDSIRITLSVADSQASIFYSLDGSVPDTNGILYTEPVLVNDTLTLRFIAHAPTDVPSGVVSEVYSVRDTLSAPFATPGNTSFKGTINVSLSHEVSEATIRYTVDGTTPSEISPVYNSASPLRFIQPTTLTIRAFNPTGREIYVPSESVSYTYTPGVAMPVADPVSGTRFSTTVLSRLSTTTYGADIFYTTDGSMPDATKNKYSGMLMHTGTTTIKAIAVKDGWINSEVLEVVYTKEHTPSTLNILDANYQEVAYLTEMNSCFIVQIIAAEAGISTLEAEVVTMAHGDREPITLTLSGRSGALYRFTAEVPFEIKSGSAVAEDGKVQAAHFDSLRVSWENPNNASDVVSKMVAIRPYPKKAVAYFTAHAEGRKPVLVYETEVDTVFIMIEDQKMCETENYVITLVSAPLYGERKPDTLVLRLFEIEEGVMRVAVPVENSLVTVAGDEILQAVKGDMLYVRYTDPVDKETAYNSVAYGLPGEVEATLVFTDKNNVFLNHNVYLPMATENLYLQYTDDYTSNPKMIMLTTENISGTGAKSFDTLIVELPEAQQHDSIGTWYITVPVAQRSIPQDSNLLEIYFHSIITASIVSHNKYGTPGQIIRDTVKAANPDKDATIAAKDTMTGKARILRTTEKIEITVNDQDFSSQQDTILVDLQCVRSDDKEYNVMLIEEEDGVYKQVITKTEGETEGPNGLLSCFAEDDINVFYRDPVYGQTKVFETGWESQYTTNIYFEDPISGAHLTEQSQLVNDGFVVVVETMSPDQNKVDTLFVMLTMSNGEVVTVKAIETGAFTGLFKTEELQFGFSERPTTDNDILEAHLDVKDVNNTSIITAAVIADYDTVASQMEVNAAYVPAEHAWIIDENSDGIADKLFVSFKKPLPNLPREISSIDWPQESENDYTANGGEISFFVDDDGLIDSSIIVISLHESEFAFGATSASSDKPPYLTLPEGNIFAGIEVKIEDRVGPVIVEAVKSASDLNYYRDAEGKARRNPDTLLITFSEKIIQSHNTGTPWDSLIMFGSPNDDKESARLLSSLVSPVVVEGTDSLVWMFIVTNEEGAYTPAVGDIIFLNPNAPYIDAAPAGNRPQVWEEEITGTDPKGNINKSFIFVPVEGIQLGDPQTLMANISFDEDGKVIYGHGTRTVSTNGGVELVQEWIRPTGLQEDGTLRYDEQGCGETRVERKNITVYPGNCLSAVQVFSKEKYIAEVIIFDHFGKVVYTSVQRFGYCGELENSLRRTSNGLVSWLVWNQKDLDGSFVGSGVYIWKVRFTSTDGKHTSVYRQGIARSSDPQQGCAAD